MENKNKRGKYTEEEIQYIRDNYPTKSTYLIAKHLGRTPSAINQVAAYRGFKKLPISALPLPKVEVAPAPLCEDTKWVKPKGPDAMPWPLYFYKSHIIQTLQPRKYHEW